MLLRFAGRWKTTCVCIFFASYISAHHYILRTVLGFWGYFRKSCLPWFLVSGFWFLSGQQYLLISLGALGALNLSRFLFRTVSVFL